MLVPKLRFVRDDGRDYPEWEEKHFSDISTAFSERNKEHLDLDVYSINNQIGFIPQEQQFKDAGYLKNTDTSIYMIVPPNHFVYNPARINVGSIGYQNLGYTVQVSSLYEVFKTTDDCNDMFIWHWFHTPLFNRMVMKYGEGGVRVYYYYDKLCETPILLPCLEEQQKIADFLSTVDEVITQSEKEVQNLEQQKKAAMQKIFSQEVRFRRDDGRDYPEWKKKTISELFEISAGGDIDKANSTKEYSKDYPYAVYANALTNKGLYGYVNYYKVERDCFTVTGRGDVGYAVARHEKFVPIVRLLVCIPKHNENVDFFAEIVNYTNILIESTGVPQLTSIQLGKIKVNYPTDIEEQQKIADFLSAYDEAIGYAKQELDKWKELKKGLLQQMFV